MSAFIVTEETIHHILTHARAIDEHTLARIGEEIGVVPNFDIRSELVTPEFLTAIGQAFYEMNAKAVSVRYSGTCVVPGYEFKELPCHLAQAYKSAKCLLYQCHEGDLHETKLYKLLEVLEKSFASKIIGAMPEFKEATWSSLACGLLPTECFSK